MKKKIFVGIGSVFVVVVLAAMILFATSGGESAAAEPALMNLDGTWKVVSSVQGGAVTLPEEEYLVFAEGKVEAYRDGESIAVSGYELSASNYPNLSLQMPDISREYVVEVHTDHAIRLYENRTSYMELILWEEEEFVHKAETAVIGRWKVAYRNTAEPIAEEEIAFTGDVLSDYRNGETEPAARATYYWNESGNLCVDALGVEMRCYPQSDVLYFVEVATGYVWELHRNG